MATRFSTVLIKKKIPLSFLYLVFINEKSRCMKHIMRIEGIYEIIPIGIGYDNFVAVEREQLPRYLGRKCLRSWEE